MPYEHIEELGDRRQEKYLLGLTIHNLAGVLALALPALIITSAAGMLVRIGAVVAAVMLGILLTSPAGGLVVYEWPLWWLRGHIRMLLRGPLVHPRSFEGADAPLPIAPLRVGGPLVPVHWEVPAGRIHAEVPAERRSHADF